MYLLALGIATLVGGFYTATELREKIIETDKEVAVIEANSVAQVISASAGWMTQQGATVATATYTDVSFLQDASCGGTAAKEYLPCTWTAPVRTGVSPTFDVQNNAGNPTMTIDWGVPTQSTAGVPSGVKAAVMLKQAEQALVNSPFTFIDLDVTADDRLVAVLDTTQENDPYLRIDGVNSMLADLDVGGNDIVNAGAVNATSANVSGDVTADRFIDRNNASTYLDPNNTSSVNVMDANLFRDRGNTAYYVNPAGTSILNQVQADTFYDRNNTAFYANPAGRSMLQRVDTDITYDRNNYGYYSDPNSVSRFNVVRPNYIEPQVTVTENTGCSPNGRIAKSSTGKILSCQSGVWKSNGGSDVATLAASGQTKLPSGLIIKWGSAYLPGGTQRCYSFPSAFPSRVVSVQATPSSGLDAGGGTGDYWGTYNHTRTSFCASQRYDGGRNFTWLAVGY